MQAKESRRGKTGPSGRFGHRNFHGDLDTSSVFRSLSWTARAIRYTYRFFSTGGFPLGHNIWNADVAVASN